MGGLHGVDNTKWVNRWVRERTYYATQLTGKPSTMTPFQISHHESYLSHENSLMGTWTQGGQFHLAGFGVQPYATHKHAPYQAHVAAYGTGGVGPVGGGGHGGTIWSEGGGYNTLTGGLGGAAGGTGAVRIVWPGTTRSFPSTNVGNP